MTLPAKVPIRQSQVIAEFTSISGKNLKAYYGAAAGVPTSGNLKLTDFLGKSASAPIDATINGGSFTTSGGYKIYTLTNTTAQGCLKINKSAQGGFDNKLYMMAGGGGGGGGGGGNHHKSGGSSRCGGGGGSAFVFYKSQNAATGQEYCGTPGKQGAGGGTAGAYRG